MIPRTKSVRRKENGSPVADLICLVCRVPASRSQQHELFRCKLCDAAFHLACMPQALMPQLESAMPCVFCCVSTGQTCLFCCQSEDYIAKVNVQEGLPASGPDVPLFPVRPNQLVTHAHLSCLVWSDTPSFNCGLEAFSIPRKIYDKASQKADTPCRICQQSSGYVQKCSTCDRTSAHFMCADRAHFKILGDRAHGYAFKCD